MEAVQEQLLAAVQSGSADIVADILKTHHDHIHSLLDESRQMKHYYFLHEACKLGHEEIVLFLVAYYDDINQDSPEGTPLYLSCKFGYYNIVDLLLCNGAIVPRPREGHTQCPYYVTAYNGWVVIMETLHEARPDLESDPFVCRWCLEAALAGGHLDMTKVCYERYKKHCIITESQQYLNDCLVMACQGEHNAVIQYLITCGAHVTADIADLFTKTLSRVLQENIETVTPEVDNDQPSQTWLTARWSSKNLHQLKLSWLLPFTDRLTVLNISHNQLTSLPAEIPWQLEHLNTFNVSHNKLESFSRPLKPLCQSLKVFCASHNKLNEFPELVLDITSLQCLDVSFNCLESINFMSSEKVPLRKTFTLKESHIPKQILPRNFSLQRTKSEPVCSDFVYHLEQLNISGNSLTELPLQLDIFNRLVTLNAASNKLTSFGPAWSCPLEMLDLSDNQLMSLSNDFHVCWKSSLMKLFLQQNKLSSLPETVCKLESLKILNVSKNDLSSLPSVGCWKCSKLEELDLSHNKLMCNTDVKKKSIFHKSTDVDSGIIFPSVFVGSLFELDLSYNQLQCVPLSVCKLVNLRQLMLNHNPNLQVLPAELSQLEDCYELGLSGTNITNIPSHLTKPPIHTGSVMAHLKHLLRKCVPYNNIKLMVTGKTGHGKSSLVKLLIGKQHISDCGENAVQITDWFVSGTAMRRKIKIKNAKAEDFPDVNFQVWDLSGRNDPYITYKLFLSPCTLCLIVFDLRLQKEGIQSLKSWLLDIEAHAPKSHVIIVGTYLDCLNEAGRTNLNTLHAEICSVCRPTNGYPQIDFLTEVSCKTKEGIDKLREIIYIVATGLTLGTNAGTWDQKQQDRIVGRMIPQSYIDLGKALKLEAMSCSVHNKVPILNTRQVIELAESLPKNDIHSPEELHIATRFLHEAGFVLHYSSTLRGLSDLYFLDPAWLADSLLKLIDTQTVRGCISDGVLDLVKVQSALFTEEIQRTASLGQYVDLLERFEIALLLDKDRLFIPSLLLNNKPTSVTALINKPNHSVIHRVYHMKCTPNGFWPRLIIQLITMIQRICKDTDFPIQLDSHWKLKHEFNWDRMRALYGSFCLANNKVRMTYWKQGIALDYGQGVLVVESCEQTTTSWLHRCPGIVITVATCTPDDYTALGFAVDQIEHIISQWFSGLLDEHNPVERLIPCINCVARAATQSKASVYLFHLQQCIATFLTCRDTSFSCPECGCSNIQAKDLMPDFTLNDLPKELRIEKDGLVIDDEPKTLGQGGEGIVFEATLMDRPVAVKQNGVILSIKTDELKELSGDLSANSSAQSEMSTSSHVTRGTSTSMSTLDSHKWLLLFKLLPAFQDYRKEVTLLSRLRHPCVITLVAVIPRHLSYVMELAPLGSLHAVIQKLYRKQQDVIPGTYTYRNMLMDRMLTCKIVYQIALALQYLHSIMVVYKDLKPQNVLVWSLDPESKVNVKLSDYGLSCYLTPQGIKGFEGTLGYQAPEMRTGSSYNEKVDIFALGMVIYYVLTGVPVFSDLPSIIIPKSIEMGLRPSLKQADVYPDFAKMVSTMKSCWQSDPGERPGAAEITSQMRDASFWMLRHVVSQKVPEIVAVHQDSDDSDDPNVYCVTGPRHADDMYSLCVVNALQGCVRCTQEVCRSHVSCLCCVGHIAVVGTQSHKLHVYFISCTKDNQEELCMPHQTEDVPLVILYRDYQGQQRRDNFQKELFVSLANGYLCKYILSRDHSETLLRLDSTQCRLGESTKSFLPIKTMMFMDNKSSIWLGYGHDIVIVDSDSLTEINRIRVYEGDVVNDLPIFDMCFHGDQVWCSRRRSWDVVEIDVGTLTKVCRFQSSVGTTIGDVPIVWCSPAENKPLSVHPKVGSINRHHSVLSELKNTNVSVSHKRFSSADCQSPSSVRMLQRKLSFHSCRRSGFRSANKRKHPEQQVCSLCYVNGALWIGRRCGDILVLNVSHNNTCGYKYGEVIAILQNGYLSGYSNGAVKKLVHCKKRIVAMRERYGANHLDKGGEIMIWSDSDIERIHSVQKYWNIE